MSRDPYRALAAAILLKARRDIEQNGDGPLGRAAREWLENDPWAKDLAYFAIGAEDTDALLELDSRKEA